MFDPQKAEQLLAVAEALFARAGIDWILFYRVIFGTDGLARSFFTTAEELAAFERTEAYLRIQQMLAKLREKTWEKPTIQEATKVITVRIPESLHKALLTEAHTYNTSVNKLCISKLMRLIDSELVPGDVRTKKKERDVGGIEPPESVGTTEDVARSDGPLLLPPPQIAMNDPPNAMRDDAVHDPVDARCHPPVWIKREE